MQPALLQNYQAVSITILHDIVQISGMQDSSEIHQSFPQICPCQGNIADFGNTHHHYQRKKKRCPFFLMNKSPKKKTHETTTVFTNQGIKMEPRITYQPVLTTTNESRKVSLSKPKAPLNVNKRRYSNPSRLASPSTLNSPQNVIEFPLFYFYPKDRCLQSALTNRQAQKLKSSKSGRSFHPKQMLKSEGNEAMVKELGAWRTKDMQFEQVL